MTPNYGRRQSSGSVASDWSDPCDSTASKPNFQTLQSQKVSLGVPTPPSRAMAKAGIEIPTFLQPLLGLDFVPYMPKDVVFEEEDGNYTEPDEVVSYIPDESENDSIHACQHADDDGLESPTAWSPPASMDDEGAIDIEKSSREASVPSLDLAWSTEDVHAGGPESALSTGRGRKKIFADHHKTKPDRHKSKRSSVKGALSAGFKVLKATATLGGGSAVGKREHIPPPPGRLEQSCHGDLSASRRTPLTAGNFDDDTDSTADWLASQMTTLHSHQQHLAGLLNETRSMQVRATRLEHSMASLQQESAKLQAALQRTLAQYQLENVDLRLARTELRRLEREAELAASQLSDTMDVLRTPPTPNQQRSRNASTTTTATSTPSLRIHLAGRQRSATEDEVLARSSKQLLQVETAQSIPHQTPPRHAVSQDDLNENSGEIPGSGPRPRANTDSRVLRTHSSSSFMRVSDLLLPLTIVHSSSSLSASVHSFDMGQDPHYPFGLVTERNESPTNNEDFFNIDENIPLILNKLSALGFAVCTDESDRFVPTRDTHKLLSLPRYRHHAKGSGTAAAWPIAPWHAPLDQDVLVWTGSPSHQHFGHDWPVVKARGIMRTTTRQLLDLLLDSSMVQRYNAISKGREDLVVIQAGVDTTAEQSALGVPGMAKIVRALNKPKLLPKTIEMLSLWYAKPLTDLDDGDTFMIVSRSVWEDEPGTPRNHGKSVVDSKTGTVFGGMSGQHHHMLRSEMLLGVQLLRPVISGGQQHCELTTITHVYSPGVPEALAKRMAPGSAAQLTRDLQALFRK